MDQVFPIGFLGPTAFYLTLYVLTLAVHVLFMNYVLAGTAYLAIRSLGGRGPNRGSATISGVLSDWMPAMLSGAITAGVAPLLFLQILYKREFYTANLLLFNRWMSILPVLIVGFYALYVLRTSWLSRQPAWVRTLATLFPFACVAFIAYSWTENHMLSVQDPAQWRTFYAADRQIFYTPAILPRLIVWAFGSLPTLCVWLGWQLWYRQTHGDSVPPEERPHVVRLSLLGILLALAGGGWYYYVSEPAVQELLKSPVALPCFVAACVGLAVQMLAWLLQWRAAQFEARLLVAATLGVVATVLGMTVCREVVRLDALGPSRLAELYPLHEAAAQVEGFPVFLAFAVLNGALIAWCFLLVRRGRKT